MVNVDRGGERLIAENSIAFDGLYLEIWRYTVQLSQQYREVETHREMQKLLWHQQHNFYTDFMKLQCFLSWQ